MFTISRLRQRSRDENCTSGAINTRKMSERGYGRLTSCSRVVHLWVRGLRLLEVARVLPRSVNQTSGSMVATLGRGLSPGFVGWMFTCVFTLCELCTRCKTGQDTISHQILLLVLVLNTRGDSDRFFFSSFFFCAFVNWILPRSTHQKQFQSQSRKKKKGHNTDFCYYRHSSSTIVSHEKKNSLSPSRWSL